MNIPDSITTDRPIKLGIIGIDHGHIFGMLSNMLAQGCVATHWWSDGHAVTTDEFIIRFPQLSRVEDRRYILDDTDVDMVLISAIPQDRAALAIEAMEAGKDVMTDKPGCTSFEQLDALKRCIERTGRIWTVNFSERFQVPSAAKAEELVASGIIGTVKQTLGTGPHRQGLAGRPEWFFRREAYGGILTDIGSHQIDQFLHFTGSEQVNIVHAHVENTTLDEHPGIQDFGEIVLHGDRGHGYIRVDWFTPDALPVWGDGRLTILGDKGYIELRKYIDVGNHNLSDQLVLATNDKVELIDCRSQPLPYFPRLCHDIVMRTQTAVSQAHTLKVMELALSAQQQAEQGRPE